MVKRACILGSLVVALFAIGALSGVESEVVGTDTAMACGGTVSCCDSGPSVDSGIFSIESVLGVEDAQACGGGYPQQVSECVYVAAYGARVAWFWSPWTGHYVGYC